MRGDKRVPIHVPDPWEFLLRELPDVVLLRLAIDEPGRYYDRERAIVLRRGLMLEEERRFLWHEVVHALRQDGDCGLWLSARMERSVEREAARRAMPAKLLEAAMAVSFDWHDFASRMKVPEPWVRFRLEIAHPSERALVDEARSWENTA
jgi:hypothetical protein